MLRRFHNLIFDFDHTLVEFGSHVEWRPAIQHIERIYSEEGIPEDVLKSNRGTGFRLIRAVHDHMLATLPPDRAKEVQNRVFNALEEYEFRGADQAEPREGARDLLFWLAQNEFECAIVSSNGTRAIERTLELLSLRHYFVRIFGRDASCRLKPYTDQNQLCLGALGWSPDETLLLGDSPDDILSGKALGIFSVAIISGFVAKEKLGEAGADRILSSLTGLPILLQMI